MLHQPLSPPAVSLTSKRVLHLWREFKIPCTAKAGPEMQAGGSENDGEA